MMRWRILGSLVLVVATGWLLAAVATATFARTDSHTYPAGLTSASWIQAPGGAQRAYFRLSLDLPAVPDLATLWIDADQQYRVYANGQYVGGSQPPTTSGRPSLVDPVDLSWRLRKGPNGIGVEVVNGDAGSAAIRARLTLTFGGKQITYLTSPGSWLATSSAEQVRYPGSDRNDASFSSAAFDASQWPDSVRATVARPPASSLMPPAVVAGPLTGKVISAGASHDMFASTAIRVPQGVRDAWLRVIASDAYTLSVDGHVIASQPPAYFPTGPGTQRRPQAAVDVYDIGPYLQAGSDPLLVHAYGSLPAAIYLDGVVDGATGPVRIATGPGWHAATSAFARSAADVLGPVSRVWPDGVRRTGVVPDPTLPASAAATGQQPGDTPALTAPLPAVPGATGVDYTWIGIALVLALWLGAAAVSVRVARRPFGRALLVDAAGHLPALAAAGAVVTLARLPNWIPPWPYIPVIFWLLVATLAAGKLCALCGPAAFRPRLPRRLARPMLRATASASDAITTARRSAQLAVGLTPAPGQLPFPPQPALAEVTAQARAVLPGLDTRPPWRLAGRERLGRLGPLPGHARRLFSRLASSLTWANGGVILVALACTGQLTYRLGYEPYSADETVSLLAAQSIRAHLVPRFPSGFLYFKGELYEYPLAVFNALTGDPVALRLLTVLTYGATVLAFGLLLLPIVLQGHRLAQVMLTLLFATAPMELQEAQLVRMYQQEQFFTILFLVFFLLALRESRAAAGMGQPSPPPTGRFWTLATRWSIPLSAVTLVATYLSLEESFILLPAVPVVLIGGLRLRWARDRRWLTWGLPALAVIGIQYLLTIITKMPALGFDNSNKPYVYYDPSQFYYYLTHYLLAVPSGSGGTLTAGNGTLYLVTGLAVVAGAVGVARHDFGRLYLSAFLWLPVLVISTVFSAHAERYIFILLPALFALAGLGALDILGWVRSMLTPPSGAPERRLIGGLILAATIPGFIWVASSVPARLQDYGLTLSRVAGVPYARHQPDYGTVSAYMRAHENPGDLFITLAPSTLAAYYAGRPPDMVIQPHPNRFIYLTETDGVVVQDYFGTPVILTASEFQQVIASHHRIWLMTDQGTYFDSVPTDMTDLIRAQFTEVAEGTQTALYFKGGLCVSCGD
jgi:hypothetical protein